MATEEIDRFIERPAKIGNDPDSGLVLTYHRFLIQKQLQHGETLGWSDNQFLAWSCDQVINSSQLQRKNSSAAWCIWGAFDLSWEY